MKKKNAAKILRFMQFAFLAVVLVGVANFLAYRHLLASGSPGEIGIGPVWFYRLAEKPSEGSESVSLNGAPNLFLAAAFVLGAGFVGTRFGSRSGVLP